jgi:hypothetical protein
MYRLPRGVARDDAEAARWFQMAADQGDAEARINLATMYALGEGVTRDFVQSFVWSRLGALGTSYPDMRALAERSTAMVAARMNPGEVAEAERRVRECELH